MPSKTESILSQVFPTNHRKILNRLIKKNLNIKGGNTLIVGAGHSPYLSLFSNSDQLIISDIDKDLEGIDIQIDVHSIPFDDNSIDCICAFELFEHCHNINLALNECLRVLKKNGKLYLSTPFLFQIHGSDLQIAFGIDTAWEN